MISSPGLCEPSSSPELTGAAELMAPTGAGRLSEDGGWRTPSSQGPHIRKAEIGKTFAQDSSPCHTEDEESGLSAQDTAGGVGCVEVWKRSGGFCFCASSGSSFPPLSSVNSELEETAYFKQTATKLTSGKKIA